MSSEEIVPLSAPEEPFTVHVLNSYGNMLFSLFAKEFGMGEEAVYQMARGMHRDVEAELKSSGIEYSSLRNALTPQRGRHEVAFVFDSASAGGMYGYTSSKLWLPALRQHGPKKTAIKHGDMIGLRKEYAWTHLEKLLVGPKEFPRMTSEMYYVVYFTNFSSGQVKQMHEMLSTSSAGPYLGYIDCSIWNPLKAAMPLVQFGLRVDDWIIAPERDGLTNQDGFPIEEHGFEPLGIEESLYDALLTFRLDQGIPLWAAEDTSMSLGLLSGGQVSLGDAEVYIKDSRVEYLKDKHAEALEKAGLNGLQPESVAAAVRQKISNGLIFNLRFISGMRGDVPAPELDAHMFTVQAEFADSDGNIDRYQIGMKYFLSTHTCEVVTFI